MESTDVIEEPFCRSSLIPLQYSRRSFFGSGLGIFSDDALETELEEPPGGGRSSFCSGRMTEDEELVAPTDESLLTLELLCGRMIGRNKGKANALGAATRKRDETTEARSARERMFMNAVYAHAPRIINCATVPGRQNDKLNRRYGALN